MRRIGLILLGWVCAAGVSACGNAEAAPATMSVGSGPTARRVLSATTTPTTTRPPHRGRAHRPVVHACQRPTHVSPTANGRYLSQMARLHAPQDCSGYGAFYDYGAYPATSYAGQANIPAGYWVYHYPYWHVYRRRSAAPPPRINANAYCSAPANTSANANGKYRVLQRRLHVPTDCATYGSFKDYGQYGATSYAGHTNVPGGYWVYRYPYWYVWRYN